MSTAAIALPGARVRPHAAAPASPATPRLPRVRRAPRTAVVVLQAAAIMLVSIAGGGIAHLVLRAQQTQAVVEQTTVRQERLEQLETVVIEEQRQLEHLEQGVEDLRAKLADRSGLL